MRNAKGLAWRRDFQAQHDFATGGLEPTTAAHVSGRVFAGALPAAAASTSYGITASPTTVVEGNQVTFTINRTGDRPAEVLYFSALSDGSANWAERDFSTTSGGQPLNIAVNFSSGEASETVKLNIIDDGAGDSGESFRIIVQRNSSDPASTFIARSDFVTITDAPTQNTAYTLTPSATSMYEGGEITFTISRSGDKPAGTVYFSAWQDSASYPGDYRMENGARPENIAVTFSAGKTSETVTMVILQDGVSDGGERFRAIVQTNPPSSNPANNVAQTNFITITEPNTSYSLTPVETTVTEGDRTITFTITRSGDKPEETIYASTLFDTATSTGNDYVGLVDRAISFSFGKTSETFTVTIKDDLAVEVTEHFRVMIGRAGAQSAQALDISQIYIEDNDSSSPGTVDQVGEWTDTTGRLALGEAKSGRIDAEPMSGDDPVSDQQGGLIDKDWYRVTLDRGHTYTFSGTSLSIGTGQVAISLYDANGNEARSFVEGAATSFTFNTANQSSASQFYYLAVSAGGAAPAWRTATGEYAVSYADSGGPAQTVDEFRDEADDTSLPFGALSDQDTTEEGVIGLADANDTSGDKDVIRVTLTQGQTYLLTMTGTTVNGVGALAQSIFTMRSGSNFNNILATSNDGPTAQMEFEATTGGTYYLRTGAGGPNHTTIQGGYHVTLQPASDGTVDISPQLQASGSYSKAGYVGGGDPLDVFTLTAPSAGGELTVDLTGLSADVDIRILTEQGGLLRQSSLNGTAAEHASVTLAAGDKVRVEVAPYGTAQSNYQLNVHFTSTPVPPVTPLPSSGSLIGDHLLRTLAEFAAAAYSDDDGDQAHDHLARIDGWRFLSSSYASTSPAETALAQLMGPSGFFQFGNAAAVVARSEDAIVLSFRGSDTLVDRLNWVTMKIHFALFSQLISAIDRVISEDTNIDHVFVTGHSLGAAMVDLYMGMPQHSDNKYKAITFAHPDVFDIILGEFSLVKDSRITSFHNITDPINIFDLPTGRIPGVSNVIEYTGETVLAHDKQLYVYGTDFLARSGVGDRLLASGLNGPGHNHFLIPAPDTGTANTLVSRSGALLMVGGDGNDLYDTLPHLRAGDTIIEHGGSADVLRLRDAPLGFGNLTWFQGTVWLSSSGSDLIVHPVSASGVNRPYIRIFNHFSETGRVEAIQWEGQSVVLPSSSTAIDGWNNSRYRPVSLADAQLIEAPDGSVTASISATGGAGSTDTVSFGGLRNSVTASLLDGVASILDTLNPFDKAPSGAASAAAPVNSIPVDIANMENVTGSSVDDDLTGSNLANYLEGGGGSDHLVGLAGNDMLDGGEGEDRINGGTGADAMMGGLGDDLFRVDDLGDQVFEAVGEGRDTVFVDASYALTADAEIEIIATTDFDGFSTIDLTGNAFDQEIWGNAATNVLIGGGGKDSLLGGAGDDLIYADADDWVFEYEGEGYDRVFASADYTLLSGSYVEVLSAVSDTDTGFLSLAGNELNNTIIGNAGTNILYGMDGSDELDGLAGNDVLIGGGGIDIARFHSARAANVIVAFNGTTAVFNAAGHETDWMQQVETLQFDDASLQTAALAQFRPLDYIATYGDLIHAFGTDAAAGFAHFVNAGFFEGRAQDGFDGFQYLAGYDDLIRGIGPDENAAAAQFIAFGFNEGRVRDGFDGLQYVAGYDDLTGAIGADESAAARQFVTYGFGEHRVRDGFDGIQYVAAYDDLIQAIGSNEHDAARHFIVSGFNEHRARDGFDGLQYIASYGDLVHALGVDEHAGARHFVDHGFFEGRARDTFDAAQYLANYADIRAAVGDDLHAATVHYIRYGYDEGRTDDPLFGT